MDNNSTQSVKRSLLDDLFKSDREAFDIIAQELNVGIEKNGCIQIEDDYFDLEDKKFTTKEAFAYWLNETFF